MLRESTGHTSGRLLLSDASSEDLILVRDLYPHNLIDIAPREFIGVKEDRYQGVQEVYSPILRVRGPLEDVKRQRSSVFLHLSLALLLGPSPE